MKRLPGPPNKTYKNWLMKRQENWTGIQQKHLGTFLKFRTSWLRKKNLSYNQCSLWGLSMISTSLGEFVRKIRIHKDILQMLLSCKKNTHSVKSVDLFYDTTFKCGVLLIKAFFNRNWIWSITNYSGPFFIHERNFGETLGRFLKRVAKEIPGLRKTKNMYIVTDEEHAITNSIEKNFPDTDRYLCQKHLKQNAKRSHQRDPWKRRL